MTKQQQQLESQLFASESLLARSSSSRIPVAPSSKLLFSGVTFPRGAPTSAWTTCPPVSPVMYYKLPQARQSWTGSCTQKGRGSQQPHTLAEWITVRCPATVFYSVPDYSMGSLKNGSTYRCLSGKCLKTPGKEGWCLCPDAWITDTDLKGIGSSILPRMKHTRAPAKELAGGIPLRWTWIWTNSRR